MRHATLGRVVAVSVALGSVAGALPLARGAEAETDEKRPDGWLSLDAGMRELRESRKPAWIVFDAASGAETTFLETLESPSLKRIRRQFVSILLYPKDLDEPFPVRPREEGPKKDDEPARPDEARGETPPTVAVRLKLLEEVSSLVVLSFREEIIHRYDREVPTPYRLSKALAPLYKVHAVHVAGAEKVDRAIRASRYAVGVGKQRDAVRLLLPLLEEREQRLLDDQSRKDLDAVVSEYKTKATKEIDAANRLEADSKFRQALEALDSVVTNYPFKDIVQQANKRKGEILRKMTYGF